MNILFSLSDKDIMFIGLFGVGIILFGVIIFYVLSRGEKKDDELEMIEEDSSKEEEVKDLFEDIKPKTKEQQEAKEELERVFKQMSADLEEKNQAPKAIEQFEKEQEENAIISYQELIKQAEAKRNNPLTDLDELEKVKEKKEVVETFEKPKEKVKKGKNVEEDKKEKTFRNSEIISPIFGVQSPKEYKESRLKKEYERKIYEDEDGSYDIYGETSNLEFLNSLKEFRSNL